MKVEDLEGETFASPNRSAMSAEDVNLKSSKAKEEAPEEVKV